MTLAFIQKMVKKQGGLHVPFKSKFETEINDCLEISVEKFQNISIHPLSKD